MSVKLVVVALLAAAVTTVSAETTANKAVNATVCAAGDCDCADPKTTEYSTTCPDKAGDDNILWKADSCTADTTAFVVKGYKKAGCAEETRKVPKTCTALLYWKAECTGTNDDNTAGTVKVFTGCTTATCDADDCTAPVTFTLGDNTCKQVGEKYYKLTSENCDSITFDQFSDSACGENKKSFDVPTTCTASHYRKSECTPGDKVTITTCTNDQCNDGCDTAAATQVPLKTYTAVGGETLYIDTCTADDDEYTFQVYAGVQEYSKTCAPFGNGAHAKAACVDATETTTTTQTTTSGTTSTTTTTTTTDANTNNSSNGSNDSNNTTTSDDGIIAPAHSVGVLALVLCVLACVY